MIVKILNNTPTWVFGLFFGLVAIGLMQVRTRRVGRLAAFVLPAGMVALSLAGISSSFGLEPWPLAAWAIALALSALCGYWVFRDTRVEYDGVADRFVVPGSWVPLAVILAIFFAKYAYAVMRALNAEVISTPLFIAMLSGVYGLLSGYFVARALNLVMKARAVGAVHAPLEAGQGR